MSAAESRQNEKNTTNPTTLWEKLSNLLRGRGASEDKNTLAACSYRRPVLTVFDRLFVDPAAFPEDLDNENLTAEVTSVSEESDEPDPDAHNPMRFEFPSWRKLLGFR